MTVLNMTTTHNRIKVLLSQYNTERLKRGEPTLTLSDLARELGEKDPTRLWRNANHKTPAIPYDLMDKLKTFFNLDSYDDLFESKPVNPRNN